MKEIELALSKPYPSHTMQRWEIINNIIPRYGFKDYLEIGVSDPQWCYDNVICQNKDSVDPGVEFMPNPVKYKMTSDEFFNTIPKDKKWDVIFIDGLHVAKQVIQDIHNALDHLSPNGFILLHDVNPTNVWLQRENYSIDGINRQWNGTVWKAYYALRITRPDLTMCVLDTDWGVGVIRRGTQVLAPADNTFYDYNMFDANRVEYLNLIDGNDLDLFLSMSDKKLPGIK